MTVRKLTPPSPSRTHEVQPYSGESSPSGSSIFESSEEEDESHKSELGDFISSRPVTLAIPETIVQNPFYMRRPTLADILSDDAPPPWTLSEFMAYLSQNHCLETLEFTMDATRYQKHYENMISRASVASREECNFVISLWQKIFEAYIAPNAPREVNLPCDVRTQLLFLSSPLAPPHPSTLDEAVHKVKELMEDSVLIPFLNNQWQQQIYVYRKN